MKYHCCCLKEKATFTRLKHPCPSALSLSSPHPLPWRSDRKAQQQLTPFPVPVGVFPTQGKTKEWFPLCSAAPGLVPVGFAGPQDWQYIGSYDINVAEIVGSTKIHQKVQYRNTTASARGVIQKIQNYSGHSHQFASNLKKDPKH